MHSSVMQNLRCRGRSARGVVAVLAVLLVWGQASACNIPVFRYALERWSTETYEDLYEGIDLHTFGRRDSLKYEFYVAPGADYRQIEVSYDGIAGLWIDEAGALHVETELGALVDDAPYIFQLIDGQEVEVAGQFSLVDADSYTFEITGAYNPTLELVVDPNLNWSSYLVVAKSKDRFINDDNG